MASLYIGLIGGALLFYLWCAVAPIALEEKAERHYSIIDQDDPRPALWTLGATVIGVALVVIGIIGMIAPLILIRFTS